MEDVSVSRVASGAAVLALLVVSVSGCGDRVGSGRETASTPMSETLAVGSVPQQSAPATVPAAPTTVSSVTSEPHPLLPPSPTVPVDEFVRFPSPEELFVVDLPKDMELLVEPEVSKFNASTRVTMTLVDLKKSQRIVVTYEHAIGASTQLLNADADPAVEIAPVSASRSAGEVFIWTDPLTKQRGVGWSIDDDTVMWVYGDGFSDVDLLEIVSRIEVLP